MAEIQVGSDPRSGIVNVSTPQERYQAQEQQELTEAQLYAQAQSEARERAERLRQDRDERLARLRQRRSRESDSETRRNIDERIQDIERNFSDQIRVEEARASGDFDEAERLRFAQSVEEKRAERMQAAESARQFNVERQASGRSPLIFRVGPAESTFLRYGETMSPQPTQQIPQTEKLPEDSIGVSPGVARKAGLITEQEYQSALSEPGSYFLTRREDIASSVAADGKPQFQTIGDERVQSSFRSYDPTNPNREVKGFVTESGKEFVDLGGDNLIPLSEYTEARQRGRDIAEARRQLKTNPFLSGTTSIFQGMQLTGEFIIGKTISLFTGSKSDEFSKDFGQFIGSNLEKRKESAEASGISYGRLSKSNAERIREIILDPNPEFTVAQRREATAQIVAEERASPEFAEFGRRNVAPAVDLLTLGIGTGASVGARGASSAAKAAAEVVRSVERRGTGGITGAFTYGRVADDSGRQAEVLGISESLSVPGESSKAFTLTTLLKTSRQRRSLIDESLGRKPKETTSSDVVLGKSIVPQRNVQFVKSMSIMEGGIEDATSQTLKFTKAEQEGSISIGDETILFRKRVSYAGRGRESPVLTNIGGITARTDEGSVGFADFTSERELGRAPAAFPEAPKTVSAQGVGFSKSKVISTRTDDYVVSDKTDQPVVGPETDGQKIVTTIQDVDVLGGAGRLSQRGALTDPTSFFRGKGRSQSVSGGELPKGVTSTKSGTNVNVVTREASDIKSGVMKTEDLEQVGDELILRKLNILPDYGNEKSVGSAFDVAGQTVSKKADDGIVQITGTTESQRVFRRQRERGVSKGRFKEVGLDDFRRKVAERLVSYESGRKSGTPLDFSDAGKFTELRPSQPVTKFSDEAPQQTSIQVGTEAPPLASESGAVEDVLYSGARAAGERALQLPSISPAGPETAVAAGLFGEGVRFSTRSPPIGYSSQAVPKEAVVDREVGFDISRLLGTATRRRVGARSQERRTTDLTGDIDNESFGTRNVEVFDLGVRRSQYQPTIQRQFVGQQQRQTQRQIQRLTTDVPNNTFTRLGRGFPGPTPTKKPPGRIREPPIIPFFKPLEGGRQRQSFRMPRFGYREVEKRSATPQDILGVSRPAKSGRRKRRGWFEL